MDLVSNTGLKHCSLSLSIVNSLDLDLLWPGDLPGGRIYPLPNRYPIFVWSTAPLTSPSQFLLEFWALLHEEGWRWRLIALIFPSKSLPTIPSFLQFPSKNHLPFPLSPYSSLLGVLLNISLSHSRTGRSSLALPRYIA